MNFQQLETLVWLSRLRNFHSVASRLNTTQPSISLRIQRLEHELGTKLLNREQGSISLTPAGRECLVYAEQILTCRGELLTHAGNQEVLRGRVSLGVSEIIADTWLPRLLQAMAQERPAVVVDTRVDMTPQLASGLEDGSYDIILAGSYRLATVYATRSLGQTRFSWMAAPGAFSTPARLTPQDLQRLPLITWPRQAAVYTQIAEWFAEHAAHAVPQHTCNSVITMARLAAAGLGVALLPECVVEQELSSGALVIVATEPHFPSIAYQAIYNPHRSSLGEIVARIAAESTSFEPG